MHDSTAPARHACMHACMHTSRRCRPLQPPPHSLLPRPALATAGSLGPTSSLFFRLLAPGTRGGPLGARVLRLPVPRWVHPVPRAQPVPLLPADKEGGVQVCTDRLAGPPLAHTECAGWWVWEARTRVHVWNQGGTVGLRGPFFFPGISVLLTRVLLTAGSRVTDITVLFRILVNSAGVIYHISGWNLICS